MGRNELIPTEDFVSGLHFTYNYSSNSASVNKGEVSHVLNDGQTADVVDATYEFYLHSTDFFNENNKNLFDFFKSSISTIHIGSTNFDKILFSVVYDNETVSEDDKVYKFTSTLKHGSPSKLLGKSIVTFTLSSGGGGDITSVVAGTGLTGGAESGDATLNVGAGTGITVNADNISINNTVATLTGTQDLTNKTLTSAVLNTGVSGTAILDEDNMASNSDTKLATQQSIKAYVDNQVTSQDLDFQGDTGGTLNIDLDSETLTLTGGTGIGTTGSGNTMTFAIDSNVITLTGTQDLTNKTLTSAVLNTGVSGTAILDEDDMASDSATHLSTQQSIKAYVDSVAQGLHIKESCRLATTEAGDLSSSFENGDTIDGKTLATNDRILIKDQTDAKKNGIYVVQSSGAPTRSIDMKTASGASSDFTFISEGTVNGNHGFVCTSDESSSTVGTHDLTFVQFSGAGQITAGDGISKSGNTITLNINELSDAGISSGDFIAFSDEGESGDPTKKESIDDIATLFAGGGLQASSAVMSVNPAQTTITSVLNTGLVLGRDSDNQIKFGTDDEMIFRVGAGDGVTFKASGLITGTTLDISSNINLSDNAKAKFGDDGDLEIYHDGSNSYIHDTGTGSIKYRSGTQTFTNAADSKTMAIFNAANSVDLNYNNSKKFETTNTGVSITGDLTVSGGDINYGNGQDATLSIDATTSTTAGRDLTISAGSTATGSANIDGGDLHLKSGGGDGTGTSIMTFSTKISGADTAAERMRIHTDGSIGIGTNSPSEKLEVYPDTDVSSIFGKVHIGAMGHADWAGFSHVDMNATGSYGLLQSSDGITLLNAADTKYIDFRLNNVPKMKLNADGDFEAGNDIKLTSDASIIKFGVNDEITLTHVHDTGLTLTNTISGTTAPIVFQLKSEENVVVEDDVIGSLEFAAGDSDGTDGATVAAGIHAIAEDKFTSSQNPTKLVFTTGVSETAASSATAKMTLSSGGDLTTVGNIIPSSSNGASLGTSSIMWSDLFLASGGVINFSSGDVTITHSSTGPTLAMAAGMGSVALTVTGDITALASDKRLKTNIEIIESPLDKINKLSGFTYNWDKDKCEKAGFIPKDEEQIGVFAQDVQSVIPQAVKPAPFDTDEDGKSKSGENYLTVQYEKIVPLLIECIKDQQKEISLLKESNIDILKRLEVLENR